MKANSQLVAILHNFISATRTNANTVVQEAWSNLHYILTYGERSQWRLYFMRFTCKKTKLVFYKFGLTTHRDAVGRFDPQFEGNEKWADFSIKCIGSFNLPGMLTKEEAEAFEKVFQNRFPKNIWLEKYLGFGNFEGLSGITEIVAFYEGSVEGDRSPRKEVTLYSYQEARNFFYSIKSLVEDSSPLPELPMKRRCTQAGSLDAEEILGCTVRQN